MNASELHRKLLYCGYDDMVDYLRNSPFNRCVYNVVIKYGRKPAAKTSMVDIFNETYYQCVKVNFDSDPGSDVENRYLKEEEAWLGSLNSAKLVFSVVWALLRCKDARTFNENCFVEHYWPLINHGEDGELEYILIKYTAGDRIFPPKMFLPMPCNIMELPKPVTKEEAEAWQEITNNFSQKVIERYLELYESPEEQQSLLDLIEEAYSVTGKKNHGVNFLALRDSISAGKYHKAVDEAAQFTEGMDLTYKEELEELKKRYAHLEHSCQFKLNAMEYDYEYKLKELREKLEEKKRDEWRKKDPQVLLFAFTEMVEVAKSRFSKIGAEEFSNMLYQLKRGGRVPVSGQLMVHELRLMVHG